MATPGTRTWTPVLPCRDSGSLAMKARSGPRSVWHPLGCGGRSDAEVEEDGVNPPVGVLAVGNVELMKQPADVGLDGPFA